MPVRTRERLDPEARRAQILEQAIRLIGERGYYGFKIQELASRCGVTNGALLHYFDSKEALLVAVLKERDRREEANVMNAAGGAIRHIVRAGAPRESVIEVCRAIIGRAVAQPELVRLHIVLETEALDHGHPAYDYFRKREAFVLEGFKTMVRPHVDDAPGVAREMLAMMNGLTLRWLFAGQNFDLVLAWDNAFPKLLAQPKRRSSGKR